MQKSRFREGGDLPKATQQVTGKGGVHFQVSRAPESGEFQIPLCPLPEAL